MTYKEKNVWAVILSTLAVTIFYVLGLIRAYAEAGKETFNDLSFWARTMLVYALIFVVATIIIMIIVNIAMAILTAIKHRSIHGDSEDTSQLDQVIEDEFDDVEDEMDKLIALKAHKYSQILVEVAFFLGLVLVALDQPVGIMLNMVFISYFASTLLAGFIKLYFYKRGIRHG